jgi:Mlc titration factor MtfA (ptsG expression regulator)
MFWFRKWQRNRIAARQFPQQWLQILEKNVPLYNRLHADDKAELQKHILIFIAEKQFEGCGGLTITDEIKVIIAAQACMLLLHRKTDYYPGLSSILVYPHAFIVHRPQHSSDNGIVTEGPQVLSGESWHRGSVVLSWDNIKHDTADIHDGHNLIFHEFAHQLDSTAGRGDSTSVLKNTSSFIAWARVLQKDYERLRIATQQNLPTFLDKYGATDPAEFFAVATEFFFEKPNELKQTHPDLYNELKHFYQQDPAGFK